MKVCVLMITYNHAPYIAEAIESVLAQQTDFQVELIVGEDCSTDNTREIVSSYAQRFPSRIKAIFNQKNLGAGNFKSVYNSADGDYLALLEGDDYWTDPLKLKKQVDFMEKNSDCAIAFHNVIVSNQNKDIAPQLWHAAGTMNPRYSLKNLLNGNFIQTCSVLYRRKNLPVLPDWILTTPMGDWPLHILHAEKGLLGYIDEVMAVYRVTDTGTWVNKPLEFRVEQSIRAIKIIDQSLAYRYSPQLKVTSVGMYNNLIDIYINKNDIKKAFSFMIDAIETTDDVSVHANFLTKYMSLMISAVLELVHEGKESEALLLYRNNIDKLPYIREFRKVDLLMNGLMTKLT